MSQPNPSTALARAVIDELARGGVTLFVISPGSRSAALAIAASDHPELETRVVLDERSAAFHALGRAKASGAPTAVIATSGTAPANHLPAVVEADLSLTPLVILSADRPIELRGVGANQTIDQVNLFGPRVRLFSEIPAPDEHSDLNDRWRKVVSDSVSASLGVGDKPGPVHINIAFREPTVPVADDGRTESGDYSFSIEGKDDGGRWLSTTHPGSPPIEFSVDYHPHGVVVAGEGVYHRERLVGVADELGWPILATAQSGMRGQKVGASYHHLLAGGVPSVLRPELVYAIGAVGPSSRVEELISAASVRIRVDSWGRHIDPRRNATHILKADPVAALETLKPLANTDQGWSDSWLEADRSVEAAMARVIDAARSPTGAAIAKSLDHSAWESLVVGSSLPIREVDAHLARSGEVIANRGASGIDGFISTALGVSSVKRRTVALTGDLGLLHDANGFLSDSDDDLVIVVVDNDGGGLFDGLPPAQHAPSYERLFVASQERELAQLARFHDLEYFETSAISELPALVDAGLDAGGVSLIRVPVSRRVDLEMRHQLDDVAREAVGLLKT